MTRSLCRGSCVHRSSFQYHACYVRSSRWRENCSEYHRESIMTRDELLDREICVSLADDKTGFMYRVKRFGLVGPRRFVSLRCVANRASVEDNPGVPRIE